MGNKAQQKSKSSKSKKPAQQKKTTKTAAPKKTEAQKKHDARTAKIRTNASKRIKRLEALRVKSEERATLLTEKAEAAKEKAASFAVRRLDAEIKRDARIEKMDKRFAANKSPEAKKQAKLDKAREMVAKLEAELSADTEE